MYDHSAWFFGTGGYPRWLGYTLGYLLAGRWRALEPEANGARLVNVTAAEVIAAGTILQLEPACPTLRFVTSWPASSRRAASCASRRRCRPCWR